MKKMLGEGHPLTAVSIYNLAYHYEDVDLYSKAEQLFIEAINIFENIYGDINEQSLLANLSLAHLTKGRVYMQSRKSYCVEELSFQQH